MNSNRILTLLESIYGSSEIGVHYAKNEYDRERYETISNKIKELYELIPGFEKLEIDNYDPVGYITPKVGTTSFILNEKNHVLLEKRMDDQSWGLPGGWAELGVTAEENVKKEVLEETGYEINDLKLIHVQCRIPSKNYPFTSYHLIYNAKVVGGQIKVSHESTEVAWWNARDVKEWHFDHKEWVDNAYKALKIKY